MAAESSMASGTPAAQWGPWAEGLGPKSQGAPGGAREEIPGPQAPKLGSRGTPGAPLEPPGGAPGGMWGPTFICYRHIGN